MGLHKGFKAIKIEIYKKRVVKILKKGKRG